MLYRFSCVVACISSHKFNIKNCLSVHQLMDIWVDSSILAIMNRVPVTIQVHIFL